MILTDSKKSQAKTVIGLESVAGVSVTSFKDGLFGLHLSEVSAGRGPVSPWRRKWARRAGVGLGYLLRRKSEPPPCCFFLPKISSVGSKGDFLLVSEHVVELLTKMYRAVLDATQKQLPVTVAEQ